MGHTGGGGGGGDTNFEHTGRQTQGIKTRLTLHDRYVTQTNKISWNKANTACARRGAYLASFNTEQEWEAVTELLDVYSRHVPCFIGLRTASIVLPA